MQTQLESIRGKRNKNIFKDITCIRGKGVASDIN